MNNSYDYNYFILGTDDGIYRIYSAITLEYSATDIVDTELIIGKFILLGNHNDTFSLIYFDKEDEIKIH